MLILSIISCFASPIVGIPAAIVFFLLGRNLKPAWNLLTLDGSVTHPMLSKEAMERFQRQQGGKS